MYNFCSIQEQSDSPKGRAIQSSATVKEVCAAWEIEDVYEEEMKKLEQNEIAINNRADCKRKLDEDGGPAKRGREETYEIEDDVVVKNVSFVRQVWRKIRPLIYCVADLLKE